MTTPGPDDPDYGDYLDYLQVAAYEAWCVDNLEVLDQDADREASWYALLNAVDSGAYEYLDEDELLDETDVYPADLTPEEAEHVRASAGEPGWIPKQRQPGH